MEQIKQTAKKCLTCLLCALLLLPLALALERPPQETDTVPPALSASPPPASSEPPMPELPVPSNPPTPTPSEAVVYTYQELMDWVSLHEESGGTVFLGCDITIDQSFYYQGESAIQVDAGLYQLSVKAGGAYSIQGNMRFTGTPAPGGSLFYIPERSMLTLEQVIEVQVEGENATAIQVDWAHGLQCSFAQVTAAGSGACAVYAPNGIILSFACLTAVGEQGVALESNGETTVSFSSVRGETGAQAICHEGPLVLDNAFVLPEPPDAQQITRTASLHRDSDYVQHFYSESLETVSLPDFCLFDLKAEGQKLVTLQVGLEWGPPSQPDSAGPITVSARLLPPIEELELPGFQSLTEEIHLVDRELPHLIHYSTSNHSISLLDRLPEDASLTLKVSLDGGVSWADAPIGANSITNVQLKEPPALGIKTWYQLLVQTSDRLLYSNILSVTTSSDGMVDAEDMGGERVASDLGGYDPPPPPIGNPEPSPTPAPPPEQEDHEDRPSPRPDYIAPPFFSELADAILIPLPTADPEVIPSAAPADAGMPAQESPPTQASLRPIPSPSLSPSPPPVAAPTSAAPPTTPAPTATPAATEPVLAGNEVFTGSALIARAEARPGGLSFYAGRGQLVLPSDAILHSELSGTDTVEILFCEAPCNTWTVTLLRNGQHMELGGLTLLFRLTSLDTGSYYCLDSDGVRYDAVITDGSLSFPIPGDGIYTLYVSPQASALPTAATEAAPSALSESTAAGFPAFLLPLAILAAAGLTLAVFLRLRHRPR